mgnify:CR=1 FL=1
MRKVAIYPGSFDPVTNGHIDIIKRGLKLFDKVIVSILHNPGKENLFTLDERLEMLIDCLKKFNNIEIDSFDGLLVDYAATRNADAILRGLRAMSDFEYEFQMALMNRRLNREVQTVFLMTGLRWIYTSSSIIKEAIQFGGNIEGMVPPLVQKKLIEKFGDQHRSEPSGENSVWWIFGSSIYSAKSSSLKAFREPEKPVISLNPP